MVRLAGFLARASHNLQTADHRYSDIGFGFKCVRVWRRCVQ